jgi:hypothetical protein
MNAGYGRGYYGEGQLARPPVKRRSGWKKLAIAVGVVGAGAVIWFMWPRKPTYELGAGEGPLPKPPGPLPLEPYEAMPFPGTEARGYAHSPAPGEGRGYGHDASAAEGRGYAHSSSPSAEVREYAHSTMRTLSPGTEGRGDTYGTVRGLPPGDSSSQQAYEDAVVASARQLQAAGAKVVLAPHLAHLALRIA